MGNLLNIRGPQKELRSMQLFLFTETSMGTDFRKIRAQHLYIYKMKHASMLRDVNEVIEIFAITLVQASVRQTQRPMTIMWN